MSIRPLPKELQEKAIEELNEVPSRVQEDIEHILEWGRQQPHLRMRTDPQFIIKFLRASKFSLQRTKEKLDFYYTFRTIAPEYFADRNPTSPEIQECLKRNAFVELSRNKSNPLDRLRLLVTTKDCDPEIVTLKLGTKAAIMWADMITWEDDAGVISGQEIIYDFGHLPFSYLAQATPRLIKSTILCIQHAYPTRIKGIYFINVPSIAMTIVNLYKSFLSKKLRERVHFYSENDVHKFYENVPRVVLPEEYGGGAGPIKDLSERMIKKFESYREWFEEDAKYGTDESKRPGKPRTADDFFNMEGSFRKLDID